MNARYLGPLPDHGRFAYRGIHDRPRYRWPGGAGLAVYLGFNLEHFAFGEGLGAALGPPSPQPDVLNYSWREYGNRVGAWRCLELFDQLGLPAGVVLNTALYDHAPELVEQLEAAPGADPVAVLAPAVVQHVGRRRHRTEVRAQALAESEVLDVEAEVHRQADAARPVEIGPADDRPVLETAVRRQRADVRPAHARAGSSVASPARTSSHSALSFQTSMPTIRPRLTT